MSQTQSRRHVTVPKTRNSQRVRRREWPRPPRRDPHTRVIAQLLELTGPESSVIATTSRPWASATFTGARHNVLVRMKGEDRHDKAKWLGKALPEAEFRIPGHIVADACVESRQERPAGDASSQDELHLQVTILTIEDW